MTRSSIQKTYEMIADMFDYLADVEASKLSLYHDAVVKSDRDRLEKYELSALHHEQAPVASSARGSWT
jgi:hypothetical protein